jgi:hypothetical protein
MGKTFKIQCIGFDETIAHTKEIKIFSNICPDNIFANNRIAKLKILEMYEMYSIKIKKGIISRGTPSGKKITKNDCLR